MTDEERQRRKVVAIARDQWYLRRKGYIPNPILQSVVDNLVLPDSNGWFERKFLEDYTARLRGKWVHSIVKRKEQGKKFSRSEKQRLFNYLYLKGENAIIEAAERSNFDNKSFMWYYRFRLNEIYTNQFGLRKFYLISPENKENELVCLINKVQNGDGIAFEKLKGHYEGMLSSFIKKSLSKHTLLTYKEIESIAITGFWNAAQNAVNTGSFSAYAKSYMQSELNRFSKAEKPIPGIRFGLASDHNKSLEERIGDVNAAKLFPEPINQDIQQKTVDSNRRQRFIKILEENQYLGFDAHQFTNPKGKLTILLQKYGLHYIRKGLGSDFDDLSLNLSYIALSSYVDIPRIEGDELCDGSLDDTLYRLNEEDRESIEDWIGNIKAVVEQFAQLKKEQQAGVLLYGFANRSRGYMRRPMRLNELKRVAKFFGLSVPEKIKAYSKREYDPWVRRYVKVVRSKQLEDKCTNILRNILPEGNALVTRGNRMKNLEWELPGLRKELSNHSLFIHYKYPKSSLYLDSSIEDFYTFILLTSQGNTSKKVLVFPNKKLLGNNEITDEFKESIEVLDYLTNKRAKGFQKVYEHGTFSTKDYEVPYVIIKEISGYPLSMFIASYFLEYKKRLLLEASEVKSIEQMYTDLINNGVSPPPPNYDFLFIAPKSPKVSEREKTIFGFIGWSFLKEDRKETVEKYRYLVREKFMPSDIKKVHNPPDYTYEQEIPF